MILMVDNYDSFTYNLYQYLRELGEQVVVKRNDELTIAEIEDLDPELIMISPGPCTPAEAGLSLEIVDFFKEKKAILGICLGHQTIARVFGGEIIQAVKPVHGKVEAITHQNIGVFRGLNNPLKVTRYHSLVVNKDNLPKELAITAETKIGEVMGIKHKELLIEGVQFHPEALLTEQGHELLNNFIVRVREEGKK